MNKSRKLIYFFLISSVLFSFSLNCNKKNFSWDSVSRVLLSEKYIPDFEKEDINFIINSYSFQELKLNESINYFKKSEFVNKTSNPIWKGGSNYCLVYLNDNSIIKLKLSSVYGLFYNYSINSLYKIVGNSELRNNRWSELLKPSE